MRWLVLATYQNSGLHFISEWDTLEDAKRDVLYHLTHGPKRSYFIIQGETHGRD